MKVVTTNFNGLLILEPEVFRDLRGEFYESWREIDYKNCGIKEKFLQDNVSISKKNVLRGLHYHENQGQLITVIYGKVFDVLVDLRSGSTTFTKYFSIELSSNNQKQIYMPPGFAHGFYVLSDLAIINYKCTQYYDSNLDAGIHWSDPLLNIPWPFLDKEIIISEKDQKYSTFTI